MNLFLFFPALFLFATEAVSGISIGTALARRSFATSCKSVKVDMFVLEATCEKKPGSDPNSAHSYLDLRNCLTHINGTLAPATHLRGQGLDGAERCMLPPGGSTELTCAVTSKCVGCPTLTKPLDLKGIIHNNDGQLVCKQE